MAVCMASLALCRWKSRVVTGQNCHYWRGGVEGVHHVSGVGWSCGLSAGLTVNRGLIDGKVYVVSALSQTLTLVWL